MAKTTQRELDIMEIEAVLKFLKEGRPSNVCIDPAIDAWGRLLTEAKQAQPSRPGE